ncbi:hypothetical protein CLAIMM_07310 [Cladophialophora immunda]|nr:hypothetical protein CLAIMM_07310 [Cladophialophora immunda]
MPVTFKFVAEDAQTAPAAPPSDLASFGIHTIFRQEAFRYADFSKYLPLTELDKDAYDLAPIVYDRMKPALRLATLFMRHLMPEFARIAFAEVEQYVDSDGLEYEELTDAWEYLPEETESFERNCLTRLCSDYRFTILTGDFARSLCDGHDELAGTCALLTHIPDARYDHAYPQTGLNSSWLWYLARDDWDTISTQEKYAKYFMFATTLVHELAHAVWIDRELSGFHVKGVENGEITFNAPEPRCFDSQQFEELGCAMELELFGSLPAFPHLGTPTTTERDCRDKPSNILFTLLDVQGRAIDIHKATARTIYSFFDPHFWYPLEENLSPAYIIELVETRRMPRRRLSTSLSDPMDLDEINAPVLSIPRPGMLKPAITADNELFG